MDMQFLPADAIMRALEVKSAVKRGLCCSMNLLVWI